MAACCSFTWHRTLRPFPPDTQMLQSFDAPVWTAAMPHASCHLSQHTRARLLSHCCQPQRPHTKSHNPSTAIQTSASLPPILSQLPPHLEQGTLVDVEHPAVDDVLWIVQPKADLLAAGFYVCGVVVWGRVYGEQRQQQQQQKHKQESSFMVGCGRGAAWTGCADARGWLLPAGQCHPLDAWHAACALLVVC